MLTPEQVRQTVFRRTLLGGYDRLDVEVFVARVSESLETCLLRITELEERYRGLSLEVQRYQENEDALRKSTLLAQRSADDLIAEAQRRSAELISEAREEAAALDRKLAEQRESALASLKQMAGLAQNLLVQLSEDLPELSRSLDKPRLGSRLANPQLGGLEILAAGSNPENATEPAAEAPQPSLALAGEADRPGQEAASSADEDAADFAEALARAAQIRAQPSNTLPSTE